MKIEMPDNNTLVIDDGNFVISKSPFGQYVVGLGPNMAVNPAMSNAEPNYEPKFDPHEYVGRSSNGLTVDASVERAAGRVYNEIWENVSADDVGDINLLREVIRTMIVEGQGRQAVYALAGGIKKGFVNGYYEGVPLAWVMKGYVDGHITRNDGVYPQGTPVQNTPPFATLDEALGIYFGNGR